MPGAPTKTLSFKPAPLLRPSPEELLHLHSPIMVGCGKALCACTLETTRVATSDCAHNQGLSRIRTLGSVDHGEPERLEPGFDALLSAGELVVPHGTALRMLIADRHAGDGLRVVQPPVARHVPPLGAAKSVLGQEGITPELIELSECSFHSLRDVSSPTGTARHSYT